MAALQISQNLIISQQLRQIILRMSNQISMVASKYCYNKAAFLDPP